MLPSAQPMNWTPAYFIANRTTCSTALESPNVLQEIPLLNDVPLEQFKDRQLIRFRGMIQDMHNPEYYFEEYEVKNNQTQESEMRCGMYFESAQCLGAYLSCHSLNNIDYPDIVRGPRVKYMVVPGVRYYKNSLPHPGEEILINSKKNKNSERQTCIVISIPALNDWARHKYEYSKPSSSINASNCNKRPLNEHSNEYMECDEPCYKKEKTCEDDDTMKMDVLPESDTTQQRIVSKEHILNLPIPADKDITCIVKMYGTVALKLNQMIEVVGFISLDPSLCSLYDSDDTITEEEKATHHPPTSLVPRIHAIKVAHMAKHEVPNTLEIISKAQTIRNELHLILSQLLFGDSVAADFLICHLLSSIYMRRDYFCLGNFPLNITHFPATKYKMFPKDFYRFLTLLVKKSHLLEITIENLNDLALLPKKDYDCNRLTSGILQLSDHTHLVIDETALTTGQLSAAGRENYKALCDLINFQRVTYDFKFYKLEYEADIPVLIFSEVKSFVPCSTQIPLKIDSESEDLYPHVLEIAEQYLKDENRLEHIRRYLEAVRHTEFQFNEDIVKMIQEDFIQLRQTNKNVNVDQLHSLMILARLMSLSYGSNTLTTEHWKKAVQMEMERMSRISHPR